MLHRRLCVGALIGTGVIHLAVVPEHVDEWPTAGVFFAVLGLVELALAAAVTARPSRTLLAGGAVVSLASAALWAVSRTVGLPIGPGAFSPEGVAIADTVATVLEVATAGSFLALVRRSDISVPSRVTVR